MRWSLLGTGIGKQGLVFSHVSLHRVPSLNREKLMAWGARSRSWSMNCPHCMSMWVWMSSLVTWGVAMRREETRRGLGRW
jgi:hypothetical protein